MLDGGRFASWQSLNTDDVEERRTKNERESSFLSRMEERPLPPPRRRESRLLSRYAWDMEVLTSQSGPQSPCLSETSLFNNVVCIAIIINTMMIAVETALIQHTELRTHFQMVEIAFTLFYTGELTVRMYDHGIRNLFFRSEHWLTNCFDACIVLACVLEASAALVFRSSEEDGQSEVLSMLRILRATRAMRFLKFVTELQVVLATSMKSMLKFGVLLLSVLFIFAVVATNYLWDCPNPNVAAMHGNLGRSMLTLFQMMTLDDWIGATQEVVDLYPNMRAFYIAFIFVGGLSLIAVVPPIFIEMHMAGQKLEEETCEQRAKEAKRQKVAMMVERLFDIVDADGGGSVSVEEIQTALTDDKIMQRLKRNVKRELGVGDREFRAFKFGLYELWEDSQLEEDSDAAMGMELTKAEFTEGVLRGREVTLNCLWEVMTAMRLQMRKVADTLDQQFAELHLASGSPIIPDHFNSQAFFVTQSQSASDFTRKEMSSSCQVEERRPSWQSWTSSRGAASTATSRGSRQSLPHVGAQESPRAEAAQLDPRTSGRKAMRFSLPTLVEGEQPGSSQRSSTQAAAQDVAPNSAGGIGSALFAVSLEQALDSIKEEIKLLRTSMAKPVLRTQASTGPNGDPGSSSTPRAKGGLFKRANSSPLVDPSAGVQPYPRGPPTDSLLDDELFSDTSRGD